MAESHESWSWYQPSLLHVFFFLFSLVTPSLVHIWNGCCGNIFAGLRSFLFKTVAELFNVEEHDFHGISNLGAMTRVLQQIGLKTYRFRWTHDANADSRDSIQVGTLRLPTNSFSLWLLSMMGVTHYVWIKDDAQRIITTAPSEAVQALLRISNAAVSRQPTDCEIDELVSVFKDTLIERRFRLLDKVLTTLIFVFLHCVVWSRHWTSTRNVAISFWSIGGFAVAYLNYQYFASLLLCVSDLFRGHSCHDGIEPLITELEDVHRQYTSNTDIPELSMELLVTDDSQVTDLVESGERQTVHSENDNRYCFVVARAHWYEIHCQKTLQPAIVTRARSQIDVDILSDIQVCAVPRMVDLVELAAHRFADTDKLLYVCVHNPLTDLHIIEMKELLVKANREIRLLIILPQHEDLVDGLRPSMGARLHTNKDTRFVATLADMSSWLMLLNAGLFSSVIVLLPYTDREVLETSALWNLIGQCVQSRILA